MRRSIDQPDRDLISRDEDSASSRRDALVPVTQVPTDPSEEGQDTTSRRRPSVRPKPGIALCMSGGGYRAMLFHLGTLLRLNEVGYLARLSRISSVSGGAITAGMLALAWGKLRFSDRAPRVALNFKEEVLEPVRGLAGKTIDIGAILGGLFLGGTTSTYIARSYNRHLFKGHTLQDFPAGRDVPDFVINASNLQSGVLWQFSRQYAGDYRVGWLSKPEIGIAQAVAASSAFPPFLSPASLRFSPGKLRPGDNSDLNRPPFATDVLLTDGGVYDNLGLETAWKYFDTVLVSDGGGKMPEEAKPGRDWFRQFLRIRDMTDNQVRGLRKRQLLASYQANNADENHRAGTYWGIRTLIADYDLPDALECPPERTAQLVNVPTRLSRLDSTTQQRLINWGYAICDAGMRRWVDSALAAPTGFPYPRAGV